MTEESAYPCPVCRTLTTLEQPCPGCGRAPDPNAAAVITLDHRILELRARVEQAKREHEDLVWQLAELRRERESRATAVRSAVALERSSSSLPTVPVSYAAQTTWPAAPGVAAAPRAEAAPRTVQNLLFILGGVLLGIAALVFTAVAWDAYGPVGRAVILSAVTLATLAVPPLVRLRGLNATAETFAALGLFLLLLDGYAAWFVNLGGIKDSWDGSFYAGTVCAITALVSAGYAMLFKLTGPRFIALTTAQPVLPLYFAESSARVDVWALVIMGVALVNAVVLTRQPKPVLLAVLAWVFHGIALMIALGLVLVEWVGEGTIRSSLIVVAVALVFAAGAWAGGSRVHAGIGSGLVTFTVVVAAVRPVFDRVPDQRFFLIWSAVAAVTVVLCWLGVRAFPGVWSTGARHGAAIALSVPGVIALCWAATYGVLNLRAATPWWHVDEPEVLTGTYQWELPVALCLVAAATALLAPGLIRKGAVVAALVALALAVPGWPPVTPWAASVADLVVATGLLVWALTVPGHRGLIVKGVGALGLSAHAVLAGLHTPMMSVYVMTAVVVLGLLVSTLAPRNALRPGATIHGRNELAGVAAGVVDLVLPLLALSIVVAFGGDRATAWRVMVLVVLAVPLLGTGRGFRGYHVVSGLVVALYPLWPVPPGHESEAIYAAASAVAMTFVGYGCRWAWVRWTPAVPAFIALLWAGPSWYSVLLEPIGNVTRIWSGETSTPHASMAHAIALSLLLVPLTRAKSVRLLAFAALIPALIWLAVFEVRWPVIPAVSLLGGLAMIAVSALRGKHLVLGVVGALLTIPGLAGALPEKWSTITALAVASTAMAVVAIGAKDRDVRIIGWLTGAVAKVLLAYSIGQAANLRPDVTAYLVLGVAGLLLLVTFTPLPRGAGRVVEAAAHAVALVALALAQGHPRPQAGVLAIWGVAIGLTTLRRPAVPSEMSMAAQEGTAAWGQAVSPGMSAPARESEAPRLGQAVSQGGTATLWRQAVLRAAIAAGLEAVAWIVLLRAARVETLEAYTLPIAALAAAVGILAAWRRADLSSWLGYGPALAAALLPSLAAVLIESEGINRRLLLGAGALLVTIAGAVWRRQAPFMIGGGVLLVLALHELVLVWQRVPAWIPLSIGGLLLVGVAITYERRLRDLSRLRDAVSKMS